MVCHIVRNFLTFLKQMNELTNNVGATDLRGRVWRVLLKYLPTNRDTQSIVLERKRKDYRDMVATYMELSGDRSEQKGID